ncbi:hypothetical protein TNCV_2517121 [Trichonephila clavipes]|nr:hypothetical protein TNCV_2517121 [Trichonephila clavipes]
MHPISRQFLCCCSDKKGADRECLPGCTVYLSRFPPGGASAYRLLHHSNNRQVADRNAKNDVNLAPSSLFTSIIDFHDMGLRTVLTVRTPKEQRLFITISLYFY